jgi:hypothetical protein
MFYLSLVNSVTYFAPSFFLITLHISLRAFYTSAFGNLFNSNFLVTKFLPQFINFMDYTYTIIILSLIYFSITLNYNNKYFKRHIYFASAILGFFGLIVFTIMLLSIFNQSSFLNPCK